MPKLLIFAPGEKVIIDKTDNTVSIIGILGGFNVPTLGEENVVPEGAALPLRWSLLYGVWVLTMLERCLNSDFNC